MTIKTIDQHTAAWIGGNELAFQLVFEHYYPRLLAFCIKAVKSEPDAEELVMNALLKLWQYKNRLHGVTDLKSYLFGILRQEMAARSRKRILLTEDINEISLNKLGSTDQPGLSFADLQRRYLQALSQLTDKQREIFLLSRDQGLTQQQIADHTGLSVNTVNNHITSSLKIIRREMGNYPDAIVILFLTTAMLTNH